MFVALKFLPIKIGFISSENDFTGRRVDVKLFTGKEV
jgi:hypothetical protein